MPAWLLAIVSHWSMKAIAILIGIALIAGAFYFTYKSGANGGYRLGYAQSLKDNPPNVYQGATTVNQQPCAAPAIFGIDIGKWALGLIHKK